VVDRIKKTSKRRMLTEERRAINNNERRSNNCFSFPGLDRGFRCKECGNLGLSIKESIGRNSSKECGRRAKSPDWGISTFQTCWAIKRVTRTTNATRSEKQSLKRSSKKSTGQEVTRRTQRETEGVEEFCPAVRSTQKRLSPPNPDLKG
jgi:hypothetical protein